jgi:membrane peptidoglycan carboxypeptidase
MFDNLPASLNIQALMVPTTLYAKDPNTGQYVEMTKFYDQNRNPVKYDQIAPVMYDALLSSEDPRFYQHGGIDMMGTARAILSNIKGGADTQGGSSISQQYVKNVLVQQCYSTVDQTNYKTDKKGSAEDKRATALQQCYTDATNSSGPAGVQRKLQEMRYAIALEQKYSKKEILLGYMNIANFGGTTYGVDAAAQRYFGVPASQLSLSQAAILAGMVQNPNLYRIDLPGNKTNGDANHYAETKKRESYVLGRMKHDGKITQAQYDEAIKTPIAPHITTPTTGCQAAGSAAYFCQYVVSVIQNDPAFGSTAQERQAALRQGGLKIYTTLDWRLQNVAQDQLSKSAPATVNKDWTYGSVITNMETSTGRLLSMAQNTTFSNDPSPQPGQTSVNYAADHKYGGSSGFQPGSTFKLFTILDWLEQGHSLNETLNGTLNVLRNFKNSCTGGNIPGQKIQNYGGGSAGGYVGTPMRFTKDSLNTGFFAMAAKLDLCDIGKDAAKLNVTNADGTPIEMKYQNSIIGNAQYVSPVTMMSAFASVANGGVQCTPKVIDKVTDAAGNDRPIPQTTCTQKVDPQIAATAAYDLQGVMNSGGTGSLGNAGDGTPVMGKTGTNEGTQTWLIQSSTAVTTAVWSGVANGQDKPDANVTKTRNSHGIALNQIRYSMSRAVQKVANQLYKGAKFPAPDQDLLKTVMVDLPNVVGMTQDQATQTLQDAGFDVQVGQPVPSNLPQNTVAAQNPGAGKAASGSTVTISLSTGTGGTIPADIIGKKLSDAQAELQQAGFTKVNAQCVAVPGGQGTVLTSDPAPGTSADTSQTVNLTYQKDKCGGGPGGGGGNG